MKRGLVPQQSWHDAREQDKKGKRNLSRLIHTVQHIPSDRSGKDTNSLQNLIKEIECFNPLESPKETKGFNKKFYIYNPYIEGKPNFYGRVKSGKKTQTDENNKQMAAVFPSSKSKFNNARCTTDKKLQRTLSNINNKGETQLSDTDKRGPVYSNISNLNIKKHVIKCTEEDTVKNKPVTKWQNPNKNTRNKFQKDSLNLQKRNYPKSKTKIILKEEINIAVSSHKMNSKSNVSKNNKFYVLDKVKSSTKRKTAQRQLDFNIDIEKIVNRNRTNLTAEQCSMVKKLTNYWNSVLNNELDESKSESNLSNSITSCKSLEHLSHETHQTICRQHKQSRNMSEITLKALKKLDKKSSSYILNKSAETTSEILNLAEANDSQQHYELYNISSNTNECSKTNSNGQKHFDGVSEDVCSKEIKNTKQSEIELVVETNQAIQTMERLQLYFKLFPNSSLFSDEICLPRSVKVMVSLLTATLSSNKYEDIWVEISEHETLHKNVINHAENMMEHSHSSQDEPFFTTQGGAGDYNIPLCNDTNIVALPGNYTNLIKVKNALKYLFIIKETLWQMHISNPISYPDSRSFDFIYEETILIEEDSDSEDSVNGEDEEVSIKDLINAAAHTFGELTNSFIQRFGVSWPNSLEDLVRTVYYTVVSALVWWVIIKEIRYAK